jgi:hypothetical protein
LGVRAESAGEVQQEQQAERPRGELKKGAAPPGIRHCGLQWAAFRVEEKVVHQNVPPGLLLCPIRGAGTTSEERRKQPGAAEPQPKDISSRKEAKKQRMQSSFIRIEFLCVLRAFATLREKS